MSTIIASNVSDGTLSIPTTYVTNGSAKAWANLNGTGTIALRDSFNVSSLTDNGTGNYTVNLTNAMSNSDYAAFDFIEVTSSTGVSSGLSGSRTASAVRLNVYNVSGVNIDPDIVNFTAHGDLA